jgi:hypothetical protein
VKFRDSEILESWIPVEGKPGYQNFIFPPCLTPAAASLGAQGKSVVDPAQTNKMNTAIIGTRMGV